MCWPVLRAERVFACVFTIREPGVQVQVLAGIKSSACTSITWPVSKASMYLHWLTCTRSSVGIFIMLSCIDGFACVCMFMHLLRTWHMHLHALRAGHISACVCKHQGLWMYLHTMASICTYSVPAFIGLYQGDGHEFAFFFSFMQI
jgi:hypothetical protein